MKAAHKTETLQIRVRPSQKLAIRRQAKRAGLSMSDWILARLVPSARSTLDTLLQDLAVSDAPGTVFAELLDRIDAMSPAEFQTAVEDPPSVSLDPYWSNYVAATLEQAAMAKGVPGPAWTRDVPPLDEPVFGSAAQSLRLYLLTHSPPAFARRNLFVDASVGARV